jgi:hypothetical protein
LRYSESFIAGSIQTLSYRVNALSGYRGAVSAVLWRRGLPKQHVPQGAGRIVAAKL